MDDKLPYLTTEQMREVDRLMIEEYGILLIQMMENAGRNLAHLARRRFLDGDSQGSRVLVLAGTGGNGGGGLVCARHLRNQGADVRVFTTAGASRFAEVPRHQLAILGKMGAPVEVWDSGANLPPADLVIDALIGYSLRGAPTGAAASLIGAANAQGAPILALDAPSGLDTATGRVHQPAIEATLPKEGLRAEEAAQYVGELYMADISVPPQLYSSPTLGIDIGPIFAKEEVLRLA